MVEGPELTTGASPDVVPRARRFVRQAIAVIDEALAEDAELVVSELVTNAALHGTPPITVRLRPGPPVRVEVEDRSRHRPILMPEGPEATTGRGLTLVAAVASRWGVDPLAGGGKQVWAELGGGSGVPDDPADLQALIDSWDDTDTARYIVYLGPVPTELLLATEFHADGVLRELALLREGEASPELAALARSATTDFADARQQVERQAAAAAARGLALTDLTLSLSADAVEQGERYLAAIEEADRSARAARLLTLASPPVQRAVRRWIVGTAVEHLRAIRTGRAVPAVRPFAAVLGDQLDRLAGAADAAERLALIETVTAELAGARTVADMAGVVVDQAVRALGVRSARVRVVTPRGTLRAVAWAGEPGDRARESPDELPLDADLPVCRAARTGRPEFIPSLLDRFAGDPQFDLYERGRSARLEPLIADGRALGTLSLSFDAGEMAEQAQLSLVAALAALLARSLSAPLRREDAQGVLRELAVQVAGVGTFDWDVVSGRLQWDQQLQEMFGRSGEGEISIDDFYRDLHPDDRQRMAAVLDRVVATVGTYEAEYRIVLPNGRVRWVAARGRALPGPDGSTARLIGVAQDTTERVEGRARIARVMDSMATAFFFLDREWRFAYLNASAERLLGRSSGELVGRVIWDEFPAARNSDFEREYRRALSSGDQVSFDAYYPAPLDAWYEVRAWPSPDGLAVYFVDISDRRRAEETAARAISRIGLLARVTDELGAAPSARSAMQTLAQLVSPDLSEWCVVTLIDDDHPSGSRRSLGEGFGWHERPELRADVDRYALVRLPMMTDDSLVVRAVGSAEPQILNGDAMSTLRQMFDPGSEALAILEMLAPDAAAVLPIMGRHGPVGMLSACNGEERGPFSEVDLEVLRDVAARAGVAIDRARLYRQQQSVAEGLQRSMLSPPPDGGPPMAVRYVAADEVAQVGGDWYDAFDHPSGARYLVIGDVVGHDTLAAAAMGQVRTLLRTVAARHDGPPSEVLSEVERVMQILGVGTLATVVVARIEDPLGPRPRLVIANAGHPAPLLLDRQGTVTDLADGAADPLLGVGTVHRRDRIVDLGPATTLVMYTDGLVERRDRPVEDGRQALARTLAGLAGADVETVCDAVLDALVEGSGEDDVALLAIRVGSEG